MAEWITTTKAAALVKYHPETIRKLIKSGRVRARKFGQVWQVDRASLLAYARDAAKKGNKRGPKSST
jgi:excisionase family DNA binding protein